MKNKLLIFTIISILSVLIYVNFIYKNSSQSYNNNLSNVKLDIKLDKNNYDLNNLFKQIPTKNNIYSEPDIWSNAYILMDQNSSYILSKYNENIKVPVASTTKIMTAIIILENYKLDDTIEISEVAATQIGDDLDLMPNEKISVYDLLLCLLLKSGNDAAYAFAEHMGYEKFVNKMNEKVKYLNLKNTEFKDPAGLDDSGYSTPYDLAVITKYALKNSTFKKIIGIQSATVKSIDGFYEHELKNSNRLIINNELFYYDKAIGGKTGYTPDAGHCLISIANDKNNSLISVILSTNEDTADASAKESKKLLEWGFLNFSWK